MRAKYTIHRLSLATRLAVSFGAAAFLLVATAALVQYRTLVTSLAAEDDRDLVEQLNTTIHAPPENLLSRTSARETRMIVRVFDSACVSLRPMSPRHPPPACGGSSTLAPSIRSWRSPTGEEWRIGGARRADSARGWVEVLLSRSNDEAVIRAYREDMLLVLGAALFVAAVLGHTIARKGLEPIARLAHRVGEIDARSLERRLAIDAQHGAEPLEIRALIASFDAMLDRLEHAFRSLTEFSAELAHELRTPIHVLRQQAEIALRRARTPEEYRDVLGSGLEELDRMRRMVDDILFLARAEDPRAVIERTRVRFAEEAGDVLEFLSAEASERGVSLRMEVPASLEFSADRALLRRALVNTISNALRYTPAGGCVTVAARQHGPDGASPAVIVEISDTGRGVAPELLLSIFDRYVRGPQGGGRSDQSPEGAGLGLAIVRGIMTLHGGTVTARSTPGMGTSIALQFPAAT